MRAAALVASCAVACVVAGCRATPATPAYDLGVDLAVPMDDLAGGGGDDLASTDLATCTASATELCNDGCDNDGNGYVDADDPACTTQLIVTMQVTGQPLSRLLLEPTPHLAVLDANPVNTLGGMAEYQRVFAPAVFLAYDGSTKQIDRRVIGGATTSTNPMYTTRDACVFNGELIIVDPTGKLHRFMSDGKTEILPYVTLTGIPAACASDGNSLYVARHAVAAASEIVIFDKGGANGPVASALPPIPIPTDLANAGFDRIIDLAYAKHGGVFIALFAVGGSSPDNGLPTDAGFAMAQIGFDGGGSAGPLVDGGVWHGIGEFLP